MSIFRRKKTQPQPQEATAVESVFAQTELLQQDEALPTEAGTRDDDQPFGPSIPEHLLADSARKPRRVVHLGPQSEDPGSTSVTESASASFATADDEEDAPQVTLKNRFAFRTRFVEGLRKKKTPASARSTANYPIRVLIGYLPEVTEKDALSYALGIADKHVENIENAYYDVFPHQGGFIYEVHEGGTGCAFVPSIQSYFESLGPFRSEVDARMHIRTATRTVEVVRKPGQIEAVMLPESAGLQTSPEPSAGPSMRMAMNKRTGVLVAGAAVFITGFFAALIIGSFMRLTPVSTVQQPAPAKVNFADTPAGQWDTLNNVPDGKYVKALRYDRATKWRPENGDILVAPAEASASQATGN